MIGVKQRNLTTSNVQRRLKNVCVLLCLLLTTSISANTQDSIKDKIHAYIKTQIEQTSNKKIEIIVASIDKRKKLAHCLSEIEIKLTGKHQLIKRNNTVSVSCPGQWRFFVPVRVKTLLSVVSASQNLSPGTRLSKANLSMTYYDVSTLRGELVLNIDGIVGSRVKRHVQQGRPLLSNLICLVCKGDPVTLYVRNKNLSIRSSGTALSDGGKGQSIAARNNSSGRRVEGIVVGVGEIEIN